MTMSRTMTIDTLQLESYVTLIYRNARSLLANFLDIQLLAHNKHVDILCISESLLSPFTPDSHAYITGCHVYLCDKGRGGGTCTCIKDCYTTNTVSCGTARLDGIQCRKLPSITVGCAYKHPKVTQESFSYISTKECLCRVPRLRNKTYLATYCKSSLDFPSFA